MAVFRREEGAKTLIRVAPQPEPSDFQARVRVPGQRFLRRHPAPTNREVKKARARYWSRCLPQLRAAYREICAYSATWIPHQNATVDHFQPRSRFPALAYEWGNFRLSDQKINSRKADNVGVQDPFEIQPGWFVLDFATFYVRSNVGLQAEDERRVVTTITLLRLNDDQLVEQRFAIVQEYARGTPIDYVERYYPFVALELRRQNLTEAIKASFGP